MESKDFWDILFNKGRIKICYTCGTKFVCNNQRWEKCSQDANCWCFKCDHSSESVCSQVIIQNGSLWERIKRFFKLYTKPYQPLDF